MKDNAQELLPLVDADGNVIGSAPAVSVTAAANSFILLFTYMFSTKMAIFFCNNARCGKTYNQANGTPPSEVT